MGSPSLGAFSELLLESMKVGVLGLEREGVRTSESRDYE